MTDFVLSASKRADAGKGVARELRRQGRVPAVLYGPGRAPAALSVELRPFKDLLAKVGHTHLLSLQITDGQDGQAAGETASHVVVKEVQTDPVTGEILHVDFYQVPMDRAVQFTVPIVLVGGEERENDGGIIQHDLREIDIECRPDVLPDHITVDVRNLKAGDVLTVSDLTPPAGVRFLNPPDEAVVSIVLPRAAAEAVDAQEQEATEPELVGKKKAEEEEA
ncbi:MAG: 50S ribosomal protein L25 [Bacteroidota bacterium]